ncbi:putative sterigmatocystin biosynthesis monooxygenase stcW [Cyphellophora attinorum]|uniref:Putative sterigmatocystin biosynthesis monooxygenase stcW n=1 Tax=Cyphellophora attinorum TaxID=1664694 RepID=A0A0N1P0Q9_9EURO|nr:putative sterigmatocystin biosynthesis monooxygenase stcW [Phialophora attinorum]KPI40886.1 putative sterigmatocystin biosynthesis monooxygenase stcW [Phialophora attinorum]
MAIEDLMNTRIRYHYTAGLDWEFEMWYRSPERVVYRMITGKLAGRVNYVRAWYQEIVPKRIYKISWLEGRRNCVPIPTEEVFTPVRVTETGTVVSQTIDLETKKVWSFAAFSKGHHKVRGYCEHVMKSKLNNRPLIAEKIIPTFAVGCRRLTPGLGFLEALTEPNVEFVGTEIKSIDETGILLENGRKVDLDVLVCATGFNAAHAPPFPVTGVNSLSMAAQFQPFPKTYLSMMMSGFPNYFCVLGPNSLIGTGSLSMMLEAQVDYITKCIRKLQRENIRSMEPNAERVSEFSDYIDRYFKKTVYKNGCRSWYLSDGGTGPRVIGLWPGSCLHAIETFRSPRWEDYNYEYEKDEQGKAISHLAWLGEGYTHTQAHGTGDLAFYLEPEYNDVPAAPFPEKIRMYELRPYSY